MLVVSRKEREAIVITVPPGDGARIVVSVAAVKRADGHEPRVRLGISAPITSRILREEIEQRERAAVREQVADGKDGD